MNIDQIIAKYVLGKQSNEEFNKLEEWKSEAEENLESLRAMQALWTDSDILLGYQDFNTESAFLKFEEHNPTINEAPKAKVRTINWKVWSSVAASIVVLFVAIQMFTDTDQLTLTNYTANSVVEKINLSDGTIIDLDQLGSISYSVNDESQFFDLDGRAYFNVAKQKEKSFVIKTNKGNVRVVGTRFVINTTDLVSTVVVEEGIVIYSYNQKEYRLTAGNKLIHDARGINVVDVNIENVTSWIDDDLVFKNVKIKSVIEDLEHHFGVEIVSPKSNKINNKCSISTNFKNQSIENIFKELSITIGLKYHIENEKFVIDEIQC